MLNSIRCCGFRGFRDLQLEQFKRVNLIVGRNNAGKTSLLEAIAIGCNPAQSSELPQAFRPKVADPGTDFWRWVVSDELEDAVIEAEFPDDEVRVMIQSRVASSNSVVRNRRRAPVYDEPATIATREERLSAQSTIYSHGSFGVTSSGSEGSRRSWRAVSVITRGPEETVALFGKAMLKRNAEEMLEHVLKVVDPRISKVRVAPSSKRGNQIVVDIGLSEMIPISQVGQGVSRLVAMFAELIGDSPRLCLIDEIETGIHHSVMEQVWTGIAEFAETFDIQVFATTHSHECLQAAHQAYSGRKNYEFSIVQLFRLDDGVQGRVLDRTRIEAGIQGKIDLRGS